MATRTFTNIQSELNSGVLGIEGALTRYPLDISTIRREVARLRSLSEGLSVQIERLRETWG